MKEEQKNYIKTTKQRLLIFIVAYNSEKQITETLKRIPINILKEFEYEILVIDDDSTDNTFSKSLAYKLSNNDLNINVLFNPTNLGYGGNQKIGYCYSIEKKFDYVVLLHGDGQYAPEIIGDVIRPLILDDADAVIGSRMIERKGAIRGGMPLYKYFGNIILTYIQNKILKTCLSEFHSGYRAYSVDALHDIPFQRNTDDFHFDTQIIIQLLISKKRIKEVPIPTYYGKEICHVNGIKYAFNVIRSTILSKFHGFYILYQREYDIKTKSDYRPKLNYDSSHTFAIRAVTEGSRVLDIGCGKGYISRELKNKKCYVVGIDSIPLYDPDNFHEYIKIDLDRIDELPSLDSYDYILMLDIIEHLDNPEMFLDKIREKSRLKSPNIIITVPNIAFFFIRFQLLFSKFNYGKEGILDMTHKRLFTFESLIRLCQSCGYQIQKIIGIPAPFPKALGLNRTSRFLLWLNKIFIFISKGMFSYQIFIEIKPTPITRELLGYSIRESLKVINNQKNTELRK